MAAHFFTRDLPSQITGECSGPSRSFTWGTPCGRAELFSRSKITGFGSALPLHMKFPPWQ